MFGCAIAYELAKRGLQPTLIEQDDFSAHASSKNPGNLNPIHRPSRSDSLGLEVVRAASNACCGVGRAWMRGLRSATGQTPLACI